MIAHVEEFILYDEMQYTRRDWRNRNRIKTAQGTQWLTVPVNTRGKYAQTIAETEINSAEWAEKHWKTLELSYRRAPHFEQIADWLKPLYLAQTDTHLSLMNQRFLVEICKRLGITTRISRCEDYTLPAGKSERLADLCAQAGGDEYVSGKAAQAYIDETAFTQRDIKLSWFTYEGYPEYSQLWGDFEHGVSILDLLFNCGDDAANYMKYIRP